MTSRVISAFSAYLLDSGYMYVVSLRGSGTSPIFFVKENSSPVVIFVVVSVLPTETGRRSSNFGCRLGEDSREPTVATRRIRAWTRSFTRRCVQRQLPGGSACRKLRCLEVSVLALWS